ncbi:MAG: hypothetical protein O8C64_06990 [Candidatus Methanoperedens sp.]|nr:hypothetical protein [Candidatus Methanoperedens sp.]MCZ7404736.1 hypothetical protein [Candidatus Methanoperedens sp.]
MKSIKFLSSDDAVSEVVDFVTILGLLVLSIGIIGVAGYPIVKNAQEANHIENTKQSFIVLANNVNKVVIGQAPSQSVELKMYGGSLSATGSSSINITANSTNITTGNIERIVLADRQMRSIESTVGDTYVAYEGTGVWAKYPNGNTILVSKPLITNQSNVLVIPIVTIGGISSTGGSGMSRVTVKGVPNVVFYKNVSNIIVTINSTYFDGWKNYVNSVMSWNFCISGGSSGDCTGTLNTAKNVDVYILNIQLDTEVV